MHGLHCGYCTPGMLLRAKVLLRETPDPTKEQIRYGISGTLCRCAGDQNIVKSTEPAAATLHARTFQNAAE